MARRENRELDPWEMSSSSFMPNECNEARISDADPWDYKPESTDLSGEDRHFCTHAPYTQPKAGAPLQPHGQAPIMQQGQASFTGSYSGVQSDRPVPRRADKPKKGMSVTVVQILFFISFILFVTPIGPLAFIAAVVCLIVYLAQRAQAKAGGQDNSPYGTRRL